jgi:hemerythrin-like domain-containing protein
MAKPNALSMLKEDHQKVKKLLDKLTSTTDRGVKTRRELLDQIREEIKVHTHIEEEIFYPTFKNAVSSKSALRLYYEAMEEHHAADKVLSDLMRTDPGTVAFGGKAKVLEELVVHHAEEEEGEMFSVARDVLTPEELESLGEEMAARKEKIREGRAWDTSASHAAE